jgi:hypothetical protein
MVNEASTYGTERLPDKRRMYHDAADDLYIPGWFYIGLICFVM